jgi:hypothetical protein
MLRQGVRRALLVLAACGRNAPPAAPPQPCTKLEPLAALVDAQATDEAHSPRHAFERTGDLMLLARKLVVAAGPLGDPSTGDYLAIGKANAKLAAPDGKIQELALTAVGGWKPSARTLVIAPQPEAPWAAIAAALAYARDQHYEAVSIAYRTDHALAGKQAPPPPADRTAWIRSLETETRAHCPALHDAIMPLLAAEKPDGVLRATAAHLRACSCDANVELLGSILWAFAFEPITLARVLPAGQVKLAPKAGATWAEVTGSTTIPVSFPAP